VLISQHTSEQTIGLRRRAFLATVAGYRASGGEVICVGRTRMVELDAFLAWLRAGQRAEADDDGDAGAAELAAAAGMRLVGGGR
jgi:hypothetical protein